MHGSEFLVSIANNFNHLTLKTIRNHKPLYLPLSPRSCPSLFFFPANTKNKMIPINTNTNMIGNIVILLLSCPQNHAMSQYKQKEI